MIRYSPSFPILVLLGSALTSGAILQSAVIREGQAHRDAITQMALAPDGRTLLTASEDGQVLSWDASTLAPQRVLRSEDQPVTALALTTNGMRFLMGRYDGTVEVFSLQTGNSIGSISGFGARITTIVVAADGETALIAAMDGNARSVRLSDRALRNNFGGSDASVIGMVYSGNAAFMAQYCLDSFARVWRLSTNRVARNFNELPGRPIAAAFSSDNANLHLATRDGAVLGYAIESGSATVESTLPLEEDEEVTAGAARGNGSLVLGTSGGRILLWTPAGGGSVSVLATVGHTVRTVLTGEARWYAGLGSGSLAAGTYDGEELRMAAAGSLGAVFAVSPGGEWMARAVGSAVTLHALPTLTEVATHTLPLGGAGALAFDLRSDRLIVGGDAADPSVRWLELPSLQERALQDGPSGGVEALVLNADGSRLAVLGAPGGNALMTGTEPSSPLQVVSADGEGLRDGVFSAAGGYFEAVRGVLGENSLVRVSLTTGAVSPVDLGPDLGQIAFAADGQAYAATVKTAQGFRLEVRSFDGTTVLNQTDIGPGAHALHWSQWRESFVALTGDRLVALGPEGEAVVEVLGGDSHVWREAASIGSDIYLAWQTEGGAVSVSGHPLSPIIEGFPGASFQVEDPRIFDLPGIGAVLGSSYPWLWAPDHSWFYCLAESPSSHWWWMGPTLGWVWTHPSAYPFLWSSERGDWLFYYLGSSDPRFFYAFDLQDWVTD